MPKDSDNDTVEHIFGMSLFKRAFGYAEKGRAAKADGRSGDAEEHTRRFQMLLDGARNLLRGELLHDHRIDEELEARKHEHRQVQIHNESYGRHESPLILDDVDITNDLSRLTDNEKVRLSFLRKKYESSGKAMGSSLTEWEQLAEKYRRQGVDESLIESSMSSEDKELLELAELERKISPTSEE
jgi:hypothetical protein